MLMEIKGETAHSQKKKRLMKRELTLWSGLSLFADAAVVIESNRICIILMHFETLQSIHSDTIIVPAVYTTSPPTPERL